MRRECRERFPRQRLHKKPLISDPDMHQGTPITHVPWCMPGSLTRGGGETFPAFLAHAQPVIRYLVRVPLWGAVSFLHRDYLPSVWICLFSYCAGNINGLVQKRRKYSMLATELCLSYTNPSMHCQRIWIIAISVKCKKTCLKETKCMNLIFGARHSYMHGDICIYDTLVSG